MKEKTDTEDNFEKTALILAILMGMTHKSYEELSKSEKDLNEVVSEIHQSEKLMNLVSKAEPLTGKELETVKKEAARTLELKSKYMRVETAKDEKVCDKCKPWQGKIICPDGSDKNYPNLDDYMKAGCFHVNCKCRLIPVKKAANSGVSSGVMLVFN